MTSKALLMSKLFQDEDTISIGGATISSDPATGAVAIVPAVTSEVVNPVAVVFSRSGGVATVETTGGSVSATSIAAVESTAPPIGGGGTGTAIAMSIVFGG